MKGMKSTGMRPAGNMSSAKRDQRLVLNYQKYVNSKLEKDYYA